jgi:hypothetical protein
VNWSTLINTADYAPAELILAACGAVCWLGVYAITIRNIVKFRFVEMPFFCATGDIVWEFLWGYPFSGRINMGDLYVWSFRAWFIFDIFIFISVFRYGYKQMGTPFFVKNARAVLLFLTLAWIAIIYTFIVMEYDNPMGAQSSYLLNFGISTLYISMWLRLRSKEVFSVAVAWLKMVGTAFYTVFFYLAFPDDHFVTVMGSIIFFTDNVYLYLLYYYKEPQAAAG